MTDRLAVIYNGWLRERYLTELPEWPTLQRYFNAKVQFYKTHLAKFALKYHDYGCALFTLSDRDSHECLFGS